MLCKLVRATNQIHSEFSQLKTFIVAWFREKNICIKYEYNGLKQLRPCLVPEMKSFRSL